MSSAAGSALLGMRTARRTVAPLFTWFVRPTVVGTGHVPLRGGVLLASNHLSFLDHLLLAAVTPRPLRFLGKVELAAGVAGAVNLSMGMIPVERGRGDLAAIDDVAAILRGGDAVTIFPEGTRSPTGELHRFRSGMARIALQAQVPVVPVGLIGTGQYWARGAKPPITRPDRGALQVRFGPPIPPSEATPRGRRELTHRVRQALAALSDQSLAERFAAIRE